MLQILLQRSPPSERLSDCLVCRFGSRGAGAMCVFLSISFQSSLRDPHHHSPYRCQSMSNFYMSVDSSCVSYQNRRDALKCGSENLLTVCSNFTSR